MNNAPKSQEPISRPLLEQGRAECWSMSGGIGDG